MKERKKEIIQKRISDTVSALLASTSRSPLLGPAPENRKMDWLEVKEIEIKSRNAVMDWTGLLVPCQPLLI